MYLVPFKPEHPGPVGRDGSNGTNARTLPFLGNRLRERIEVLSVRLDGDDLPGLPDPLRKCQGEEPNISANVHHKRFCGDKLLERFYWTGFNQPLVNGIG